MDPAKRREEYWRLHTILLHPTMYTLAENMVEKLDRQAAAAVAAGDARTAELYVSAPT